MKTYNHHFFCTICGKEGIPVNRQEYRLREPGHLKKLYCLNCKREVNHAECIEGSKYDQTTFRLEFESGNFDSGGIRITPLEQWIKTLNSNEEPDELELTVEEWLEFFEKK